MENTRENKRKLLYLVNQWADNPNPITFKQIEDFVLAHPVPVDTVKEDAEAYKAKFYQWFRQRFSPASGIPDNVIEWFYNNPATQKEGGVDKIDPIEFSNWMNKTGWTWHSDLKYFYRSDDFHQWPPDEYCDTPKELYKKYLQSLK